MQHSLSEEDIQGLAASAHGFVGADVAALCQEATMFALRRIVKARSCSAADAARDGRLDAVQKVCSMGSQYSTTTVPPVPATFWQWHPEVPCTPVPAGALVRRWAWRLQGGAYARAAERDAGGCAGAAARGLG